MKVNRAQYLIVKSYFVKIPYNSSSNIHCFARTTACISLTTILTMILKLKRKINQIEGLLTKHVIAFPYFRIRYIAQHYRGINFFVIYELEIKQYIIYCIWMYDLIHIIVSWLINVLIDMKPVKIIFTCTLVLVLFD